MGDNSNQMSDAVLTADLELVNAAEMIILSSLFAGKKKAAEQTACLLPEHFSKIEHQVVFSAIRQLIDNSETIDIVRVASELENKISSPVVVVSKMVEAIPQTDISAHVSIVQKAAEHRRYEQAKGNLKKMIAQSASLEEIRSFLNDAAVENSPSGKKTNLTLLKAADISPVSIGWIWRGYVARGKLHIIAGPPGTGKTTVAINIGATISAKRRFPDGTAAAQGNVIIWSGEDDPQDTLVPRLIANGGDPRNVYFIDEIREGSKALSFDPSRHMPLLAASIKEIGSAELIILDPIVNAVSGDSHKNTEVRRALQPVVELAAEYNAAVIGISHFSKGTAGQNPVERVTGSIAFGALARVVFAAVKSQTSDGEEKRLFTRAKSNIGPDGGGFYYTIRQTELFDNVGVSGSLIEWQEGAEGDARSLLAGADASSDSEERGALSEVQEWLRDLLLDVGSMEKNEVLALARQNKFAERTVQRAREKIRVKHRIEGFGKEKRSFWFLSDNEQSICAIHAKESRTENIGTIGTNESQEEYEVEI